MSSINSSILKGRDQLWASCISWFLLVCLILCVNAATIVFYRHATEPADTAPSNLRCIGTVVWLIIAVLLYRRMCEDVHFSLYQMAYKCGRVLISNLLNAICIYGLLTWKKRVEARIQLILTKIEMDRQHASTMYDLYNSGLNINECNHSKFSAGIASLGLHFDKISAMYVSLDKQVCIQGEQLLHYHGLFEGIRNALISTDKTPTKTEKLLTKDGIIDIKDGDVHGTK